MECNKVTFHNVSGIAFAIFKVPYDPRKMVNEADRLETFKSWPENNPLKSRSLAKAGFCYIAINDAVKCFVCGGLIDGWESGDNAMEEHKRIFPQCEFVKNPNSAILPLQKGNKAELAIIEVPRDPEMASEAQRLDTFKSWPKTNPLKPNVLAGAGFYSIGYNDVMRCFSCGGMTQTWKSGNTARIEHKRLFPTCDFMTGRDSKNVPSQDHDSTDGNNPERTQKRLQGIHIVPVHLASPPINRSANDQQLQHQVPVLQTTSNAQPDITDEPDALAKLGTLNKCKHPSYQQEKARLKTFIKNWPTGRGIHVTPRLLAKAGFFFTGQADLVRCFYCDVGVINWEPNDEPWSEHAKCQRDCEWLIEQQKRGFIDQLPVDPKMKVQGSAGDTQQNPASTGMMEEAFVENHVRYVKAEHMKKTGREFASSEEFIKALKDSLSSPRGDPILQTPHNVQVSDQQEAHLKQQRASHHHAKDPKPGDMAIAEEKAAAIPEYSEKAVEPETDVQKKLNAESPQTTPSMLKPVDSTTNTESPSVDRIMQSPSTQKIVRRGFDEKLVRYVVVKHVEKTGREFSSPGELFDAILAAEEKGIDVSFLMANELTEMSI